MIIYRKKCKDLVIPVGLGPNVTPITGYELQNKTVDSSTVEQFITSDVNFYGLYSVTVRPYILDAKTVDSSTVQQVVTSDASALYQVIVNPYTLESKSQTITQNGEYSLTPHNADGISRVNISVNVADIPAVVQTKSVTYTENGEYSLEPDAEYNGLSHVDISVEVPDVPTELQDKTVDPSTSSITVEPDQGYDGLSSVTVSPYSLENKTINSSTSQQTVSADNGYDGLNVVTVEPYVLDSKTVNPSTNSQTVTSSEDGLSSVTVNAMNLQSITYNPHNWHGSLQTLTPAQGYDGFSFVEVGRPIAIGLYIDPCTNQKIIKPDDLGYDFFSEITVIPYTTETDSSTLTQNGTYTFTPQNADALSQVTIDVSVAGQQINNQNKTVDSSTVSQTVTPDQGYTGLGQVTVNPYTLDSSTVDPSSNQIVVTSNADGLSSVTVNAVNSIWPTETITRNGFYSISAQNWGSNFFDGVDIDVSVDAGNLQTKTVNSSTSSQTIIPDYGYTALSQVTVNPYTTETITRNIFTNGTHTIIPNGADALSSVTVNVDTVNNQNKTVNPSTSSQSITADSSYTGLGTVTVNAVTAAIDPYLVPGNIKKDVEILGVIGTYEGSGSSSGIQVLSMQGNDFSNLTINNLRTDVDFTVNTGRMTGFPIFRDSIDTDIIYFNGLETLDLTYIPQYPCINSTVSNLRAIDMPNLTSVTKPITGWITPWKDLTLSINWHALTYSSANYNITADIGSYLRDIFPVGSYGEVNNFITDSIYLSWASRLSTTGVITILTYLGSNVSNKSVNFYTGGLTITDNYIGQAQSLYNTAVSNGWTINNLTIIPYGS